ncbi:RNA polymerase sigma factor [Alkalicaulis satelles]|nr:RNA polymerase sigma factor [Alkalicaulis satelles]
MTGGAQDSDADLVHRALDGDERAYSLLMKRHKDGLYRFARRYSGNGDDALEIVQLTFISAWQALRRFETGRAFDVWLRAIALNKCRDMGRRRKVRHFITALGQLPDNLADPPTMQAGPEAVLLDREALRQADAAIAALPHGLKAPLLLTALEGLTMAEAGAVLGMSAKAVENRLYRARKALAAATTRHTGD